MAKSAKTRSIYIVAIILLIIVGFSVWYFTKIPVSKMKVYNISQVCASLQDQEKNNCLLQHAIETNNIDVCSMFVISSGVVCLPDVNNSVSTSCTFFNSTIKENDICYDHFKNLSINNNDVSLCHSNQDCIMNFATTKKTKRGM